MKLFTWIIMTSYIVLFILLGIGLMAFSVAIGVIGIFLAYRFYVQDPSISERLAQAMPGPHRVLSNK